MADLNSALPVEALSSTAHIESMARRQTSLAAMPQLTQADKTTFRQKQKIVLLTDMSEKIIRKINELTPEDSDNDASFNQTKKAELQQLVRALLIEERKQSNYLSIAQTDGFQIADVVFNEPSTDLTTDRKRWRLLVRGGSRGL